MCIKRNSDCTGYQALTLSFVRHPEVPKPKLSDVLLQCLALREGLGVFDVCA